MKPRSGEIDDYLPRPVVERVERPTESILRITVQLTSSADDPNWLRPNVAFRNQLGPRYDDVSRIYAVRTFDASSGSMTFDVVLIRLQWPEGLTGVGWVATDDTEAFAVWGARELDQMRAIRAHFRETVGLAKDGVVVFGYWKRGVSTTEIYQNRLRNYTSILESGGTLADIDDLAIGI
ncbi:MAG: SIP domain-containing protein [Rhodococcus sp. (in: high G+C Gram-positive bacteria)]|uniref:SIP domain-containing protein n=1 Tax=Rhodococcus sp. TaxID=1831 RepID=UPI002AD7A275|nr:SIP domain-containing protein [Rhodococcus sp. (in: high G+C Gram-positive bacteria)]